MVKNAGVAQMAEQGFCKPQVVGSIPTASTIALLKNLNNKLYHIEL
jgi:hypothetical protein